MLLMAEKGIRGGICLSIHRYGKAGNKYMENYDKNKGSSYLKYWNVNSLYGWAMLQKLPANNFEWIEDTSQFNKDFIKMKDIFSKLMFSILKNYMNFTMVYHFYHKE